MEEFMDDIVAIVRTTCLLESRSARYGDYLARVLPDSYGPFVEQWAQEESGHGRRLRGWLAEHDPDFDVDDAFARFSTLPYHHDRRRDRPPADELLSRCVVEALASGFYNALADAAPDPDLKRLCRSLMADEARHFKGFLTALRSFPDLSPQRKLQVVLTRIRELDDDQIIFASHCATGGGSYDRDRARARYLGRVYPLYRPEHLSFVGTLIGQALGPGVPPWLRPAVGHALAAVVNAKQQLLPDPERPATVWDAMRQDVAKVSAWALRGVG